MAPPEGTGPTGTLTPLSSLSGRYELLGRLGSGGMAEVFLARAVGLHDFEKIVVLKRVLPERRDDRRFAAMFRDEARVAATLEHPNIVHTHDIGMQGDECFFTMEYLHGEDLKAVLSRARETDEPLPLELALQIAVGCAAGLHHAHEQTDYAGTPLEIVHRDVSPANVIVTRQSGVKLIDFGIAKATSDKEQTGAGVLKGKVAYMSPEQCRGEVLDRRSDIFAMGVMLYEMVAMTRPFRANNVLGTVEKIVREQPPSPRELRPECPEALERVVLKALHKDVDQRYRSAFEMQEELELVTRDCGLHALPGALGRYLEHLFGPKPHPWTRHADTPPAVPRWAWTDLDSTITSAQQEAEGRKKIVVRGPLPASDAVATTARLASSTEPNPAMQRTQADTGGSQTDAPTVPPTASHPVVTHRLALKSLLLGGLVGGVIAVVGVSLWLGANERGESATGAAASLVAAESRPKAAAPASSEPASPTTPTPSEATPEATPPPLAVAQPEPEPVIDDAELEPEADETETDAPVEDEPPARPSSRKGSAAEAEALLSKARANLMSDPARAYRDAKASYAMRRSQTAAQVMGFAACRLRDEGKARYAHRRLRGTDKTTIESACLQAGIDLR